LGVGVPPEPLLLVIVPPQPAMESAMQMAAATKRDSCSHLCRTDRRTWRTSMTEMTS
jgi:hypothetical protein